MKKINSILLAATMLSAGCSNEAINDVDSITTPAGTRIVKVCLTEQSTKTTLNASGLGLDWESGDQVAYFIDEGTRQIATVVIGESGKGEFDITLDDEAEHNIRVIYPVTSNTAYDTAVYADYPKGVAAVQSQASITSFSGINLPMTGSATVAENATSVEATYATAEAAILEFKITANTTRDTEGIKSLVVSSGDNTVCTVNLTSTTTVANAKAEGARIYAVVPAGTYDNLKIKVVTDAAAYVCSTDLMEFIKDAEQNRTNVIANGSRYIFPSLDFERESVTRRGLIAFAQETMSVNLGQVVTLSVSIEPAFQNEDVTFVSSHPEIASVDAETGELTGLKAGTATITAQLSPAVKAEIAVTVSGDYQRTGWTMYKTSQSPLPTTPKGNSMTAAFDNIFDIDVPATNAAVQGTNFGLTRPGKNSGGVNVPANENIWFVVDMQQARSVNYFRIKHTSRRNGDLGVRWRYFVDILGSNTPDDESWVSIKNEVGNVDFTTYSTTLEATGTKPLAKDRETPNISLQTVNYRYIKFVGDTTGSGTGNTVQFAELYLGLDETEE